MPGTGAVERMLARGFVVGLALLVDGEAVGELGAVVGQDGVDLERKAVEKAGKKACGGDGAAIGQDLEIDKAVNGGAILLSLGGVNFPRCRGGDQAIAGWVA